MSVEGGEEEVWRGLAEGGDGLCKEEEGERVVSWAKGEGVYLEQHCIWFER